VPEIVDEGGDRRGLRLGPGRHPPLQPGQVEGESRGVLAQQQLDQAREEVSQAVVVQRHHVHRFQLQQCQ
jgi:hypothetical protein